MLLSAVCEMRRAQGGCSLDADSAAKHVAAAGLTLHVTILNQQPPPQKDGISGEDLLAVPGLDRTRTHTEEVTPEIRPRYARDTPEMRPSCAPDAPWPPRCVEEVAPRSPVGRSGPADAARATADWQAASDLKERANALLTAGFTAGAMRKYVFACWLMQDGREKYEPYAPMTDVVGVGKGDEPRHCRFPPALAAKVKALRLSIHLNLAAGALKLAENYGALAAARVARELEPSAVKPLYREAQARPSSRPAVSPSCAITSADLHRPLKGGS